jgi:hypothetical protein
VRLLSAALAQECAAEKKIVEKGSKILCAETHPARALNRRQHRSTLPRTI